MKARHCVLLACVAVLAATQSARAQVFLDDFEDGLPSYYWDTEIAGTGPTIVETGGKLHMTIPDTSTGSSVVMLTFQYSTCNLLGDFDIQVDYSLIDAPATHTWGLEIFGNWPGGNGVIVGRLRDNYRVWANGSQTTVNAGGVVGGTIRMVRFGNTVTGYYKDATTLDWTFIGSTTVSTLAMQLGLRMFEANTQPLEPMHATFDNVQVMVGSPVCPYDYRCGNGNLDAGEDCEDGNQVGTDGCCACLANPPAAADVSGGWQLSVLCPDVGFSMVRSVDLAQSPGANSATVSLSSSDCGALTANGETRAVASCVFASHPAEICASKFLFAPASTEATFAGIPVPGTACPNFGRIVTTDPAFGGTISVDGSNRAVHISGAYGSHQNDLYNEGEPTPCAVVTGSFGACTFQMARNVADPTNLSVQPLPGVSVSFDSLSEPVTVQVVPETTPAATVPPGYAVLGGQYFEITTTSGATPSGQITVCLPYSVGIDPGITPLIGHEEPGGVFSVLSATQYDNPPRVCAVVQHLSQFAVLIETACGNGIVELGEQCDDANLVDTDCCSNNCQARSGACTDDGNECTLDVCGDGDGVCTHDPITGPCEDDGNLCTDDVCSSGTCTHIIPTSPCATAETRRGSLALRTSDDASRNLAKWKWRGADDFDVSDLGPADGTTDLALCVYDAAGEVLRATVPAYGSCDGSGCWKIDLDHGKVSYADTTSSADGIGKMQGASGEAGKGKLSVIGKGAGLPLGPLGLALPVRARLVASDGGGCWESTFSMSTNVAKNDPTQFKAKSD